MVKKPPHTGRRRREALGAPAAGAQTPSGSRRGTGAAAARPPQHIAQSPEPSAPPPSPAMDFTLFAALTLAALAALYWSCRGAPLGVPVADDYDFLYTLRFARPLEWFDSMGATVYWRPLGRQLYFMLLGPSLPSAPWLAASLHAMLFASLAAALFAFARRALGTWAALAIATFPLLGEPARVLLGWPSGAQYLLGALFVAVAAAAAVRGAWRAAALGALAAALCHEIGVLAIAALPLAAWSRRHALDSGAPRRAATAAAAAGLTFAAGYALALTRGARLSGESGGALHWEQIPAAYAQSVGAQLNLEALPAPLATWLAAGYGVVAAVALVLAFTPAARARLRAAAPWIAWGAAWFAVTTAAIALAPAWNAWRTFLPSLGLAVAVVVTLAAVRVPLLGAFVALRLVALLAAPPAPALVTDAAPKTTSDFSFGKMARVQRTVESTRRALMESHPQIPNGADVRFTEIPRLTTFGFKENRALRVWYGDSTLHWRAFGGATGFEHATVVVTFDPSDPWPARVVQADVFELLDRARIAMIPDRLAEADSLIDLAIGANTNSTTFRALTLRAKAAVAMDRNDLPRADSLIRVTIGLDARPAETFLLAAMIAERRADRARLADALQRCLARKPNHAGCLELARRNGLLAPGR